MLFVHLPAAEISAGVALVELEAMHFIPAKQEVLSANPIQQGKAGSFSCPDVREGQVARIRCDTGGAGEAPSAPARVEEGNAKGPQATKLCVSLPKSQPPQRSVRGTGREYSVEVHGTETLGRPQLRSHLLCVAEVADQLLNWDGLLVGHHITLC